ncbi:hypothetical protein CF392_15975 [Tamilnaduibacter salinus]|uniref:Uncharacterized protein n=1 Tax=Tamilnaduibacter salinus TaxID=1484056 RepID=A0A2A2I0F5_9GAMM|nr:hypothetical protein [Tamilnaduibacter salinus]PAV24493.1 hypothetical protein CF392_15975 [Tamilnaduibacter salinus]
MDLNNRFLKAAMASSFLFVVGCSSSSDSNTVTRTGQAIDGYLLNAEACVDVNFNSRCDDSEPKSTTSSASADKGRFEIRGIQPEFRNAPTLVRARPNQTFDTDTPESALKDPYDLRAPASAKVVTPLTTLVQQRAEDLIASGSTVDDAVGAAKQQIQQTWD